MKLLRIIVKGLAIVVAALLVLGICYEQFGIRNDRKRLPQIGRSVDIGGRALNIFCSGSGDPTVVFESGGDAPGLEWQPMQTAVAKFTQACWYDRAGIGWSAPGPYPRTSGAIARDLHELLHRAGLPPPYVLTGASFGGLNSRIFAGLYPNEVAGLVLVDSAHEEEPRRAPKFFLGRTMPRLFWHPFCLLLRALDAVGVLRLSNPSPSSAKDAAQMSREETIVALRRQPKSIVNNIATGVVLPESFDEARSIRTLGDLPMIVLTAGKPIDFDDAELNRQAAAYQQVWIHEIQPSLARLSARGRQIVVANANHGTIPPEVIISAIHSVIEEAQAAGREQ